MLGWEIDGATNVVFLAIAFWMYRGANRRRHLRRFAFTCGALLVVSSLLGIGLDVLVSLDPFAGEVGERAAAGSYTAMGFLAFLSPTIVAGVLGRGSRDDFPSVRSG